MEQSALPSYIGPVYPGLRPFRPDEEILFFGREEQVDELLSRLADARFMAVIGLSGTGKSSLVQAGLVPALNRGNLVGANSRWRVAIMKPGLDPLKELSRALNATLGHLESRRTLLRSGRMGLADASKAGREPRENLLLVVDQFEELFRFQKERSDRAHEAQEFVSLMLAAAHEYSVEYRIYVVLTMRSDFLGECGRFPGLVRALNEGQYLTETMSRSQLKDAIEGPAGLGGATVDSDLLDILLDKAASQHDQLPVLQHLLMRMWEVKVGDCITLGNYEHPEIGGWDRALDLHADLVFDQLSEADRPIARSIYQRLTEKGEENRESRRPTRLAELVGVTEAQEEDVCRIIEHFRRETCSFLNSPDVTLQMQSLIDITHESLIRQWQTLASWTDEESDWGNWYQRLEDRLRTDGRLSASELAAVMEVRHEAAWNEVWAERYRVEKNGIKPTYKEVIDFLESQCYYRPIISFSQLVKELVELINSTKTGAVKMLSLTPAIGYLAKSRSEWEALESAIRANLPLIEFTCQTQESLAEWHAEFENRITDGNYLIGEELTAEASEVSEDILRLVSESKKHRLSWADMPDYYLFTNSERAILVNPFFLPSLDDRTSHEDRPKLRPVEMFGLVTNAKNVIAQFSEVQSHYEKFARKNSGLIPSAAQTQHA